MSKIFELKQILKKLTTEIRKAKNDCKEYQRDHYGCDDGHFFEIFKLKYEFRHKHIAYCILRGTEYEKIETPAEKNVPNEKYYKEIINEYTEVIKDVCVSS